MLHKVGAYVRQNHLALFALFVALGGTGAYAAAGIGAGDIKNNAIRSRHIKNGAVGAIDVRDSSLTSLDVKDESLTGVDVLNGSLAGADVQNGSLAGADVQDGSLTGGDVLNGSLTGADVQDESLTGGDVLNGSLAGADVQNGSLTGGNLANGTVAPANLGTIPSVRARRTAVQSIPTGSFTPIQLTSETWDHLAMHSNVNNTRLTAPIGGVYLLTASVFWADNSTGERDLGFRLNGTDFVGLTANSATDISNTPLTISTVYLLNAGDFAEALVEQTSGAPLNLAVSTGGAETSPEVSMTWLGPG